jgi:hypothetical protein
MRRGVISPSWTRSLAAATVIAALWPAASASASAGANARAATRSERQALAATFDKEDGNSSEIRGVYVSRANSSLAVVCAKTPESGTFAYVFARTHAHWRYATSGRPGRAGSGSQRQLERACS